jgi:hypothetical protein
MECDILPDVEDDEIQWKFQEILQLLRYFKEHIFDFQQIANKMKGNAESNMRPKNFYTSEMCESAFRKILEISKEKPYYVEFFKEIPYSLQLHGFKLLEQYEEYHKNINEFVEKTLLNDKFKNMLVAMEKGELSEETADKMLKFCNSFPSLVQMAGAIDKYDKVMEEKSIFENLMPERHEIPRFSDLQASFNTKLEEMRIQKEAESQAAMVASSTPKLPNESQTLQIMPSNTNRSSETKSSSKSSPLINADVSTKKSRPCSAASHTESRPKTPTETPVSRKKKPSTQQSSGLKFSTIKHTTPAAESEGQQKMRHSSVSSKKSKSEHRTSTSTASGVETQTYLSLVGKYETGLLPPMVDKSQAEPSTESSRKKRTVMTQTGNIHLNFGNDMETLQWYDDGDIPNEMTTHLANSCLRSNTDFDLDKPIKCNLNLKENNITNPSDEKLKKHPLYEVLKDLKDADIEGYFTYPVKIEVPDYPAWIKRPMDLLTIEDLMIEEKIKDIVDLEFYCALICTNAIAYGVIPAYAESYSDKSMEIFYEYRLKQRK